MPILAEPEFAVVRAKLPEGSEPRRGVAWCRVRTGRDQPAFDNFAQKPLRQQPLAVGSRELFRPEDMPSAALQLMKLLKRRRELLM